MAGRFKYDRVRKAQDEAYANFSADFNLKSRIHEKGYRGETVITLPGHNAKEIIKWCKNTFGEPGRDRRYAWRYEFATNRRIFLRTEEQVLAFRLRWL
ncbi:MAG TPA: hypothetical protein VFM18_17400 [Methanosarcina sp.]|nr:hypothetical protein [Methanosarcina sp.]